MYKVDDYVKAFKENSIKITPQRLAIFKIIQGNTTHPSAEEIYKEVLKDHPTISFATVYNTLDKLYDLKLLLRLNIDKEKKHFDPNTNLHHHFLCTKCLKIIDVFDKYEIDVSDEVKKQCEIESYQISFYGICSECNLKGEDNEKV